MKSMKDENIKAYLERYYVNDDDTLNPETVKRYKREARQRFPQWLNQMEVSYQLKKKYTDDEISQIARGERIQPKREKRISFEGNKIRFAFITDTHFGASCFDKDIWDSIVEEINKSNVDFVIHTGDIVNGFDSKKEDMVFDMTHIGYSQQKNYAKELLGMINKPIYTISGNHDRFFYRSTGAKIVEDISLEMPNVNYLGEDMADLMVDNIKIRLWHGEDGSSSTVSYRLQKITEMFGDMEKPDILLCGHTHKQCYIFDRNIHVVSGGAVCKQSAWMQRKRLANHTGFHIIEVEYNERGVTKFTPTFYPFYS